MGTHFGGRETRAATPVTFVQVSPALIAQLAAIVEAGIELLDQIGGDPDDEPSIAGNHPNFAAWADVEGDDSDAEPDDADREDNGDDEPDVDAEPDIDDEPGADDEPDIIIEEDLGAPESQIDQRLWSDGSAAFYDATPAQALAWLEKGMA